jgi:hypothetical protein
MNEEKKRAEALSDFLDDYVAGEQILPHTPEARLAAELADLAASLQLAEPPAQPIPSPTPPSFSRPIEKEDRPMIARHSQPARSFSLPFVAVLALFMLVAALLPFTNQPAASPPFDDPARLPLPVGGYLSSAEPGAMRLMRDAGMEWVAFHLNYSAAENDALRASARALIDSAHAQGFRAWVTLGKSFRSELGEAFTPEDGFELYAQTAGEIAALGADAIQIWEEPNLSLSWFDEKIDPAIYVDLLRQASEAINAANPQTLVVSAPPAPTSAQAAFGSDSIWNDDIYYQAMASLGAAEYIDCVGVRYTEGVVAPDLAEGDPRDNYPTRYLVPMIQRGAAAFRESGLPICLSEYGYLAGEGELLPDGFEWTVTTNATEQAEWLAEGIQIAAQLSSVRVQMVLIYRVDPTGETVWDSFAIIRPDGSCPACEAIAALKQ